MSNFHVISGGPGTGKTSLINELGKRGYRIVPEAARRLFDSDPKFAGKSIMEIDLNEFHKSILEIQKKDLEKLLNRNHEVVFFDRGFLDTLAYMKFNNLDVSEEAIKFSKLIKYRLVFICDFLDRYSKDNLRQEPEDYQKKVHREIVKTYEDREYSPINIPFMSVKKRADFIISRIINS